MASSYNSQHQAIVIGTIAAKMSGQLRSGTLANFIVQIIQYSVICISQDKQTEKKYKRNMSRGFVTFTFVGCSVLVLSNIKDIAKYSIPLSTKFIDDY